MGQFERLMEEIGSNRRESNEIYMYLMTLEKYFAVITDSNNDFISIHHEFQPLMYSLLLVYKNSKHYQSASRIVLLIREICNAIIKRA